VTTARSQNRARRPRKQGEIKTERPCARVHVVEQKHLVERNLVSPEHLPQPSHAWLDEQSAAGPSGDAGILLQHQRPRAHERHLATKHIHKLRQLVKCESPQKSAHAGHARIVVSFEQARVVVYGMDIQLGDLGELFVRPGDHRAELEHPKKPPLGAPPRLLEEHGAPRIDLDREGNEEQQRAQDDEQDACDASLPNVPSASTGEPRDGRSGAVDLCDREEGRRCVIPLSACRDPMNEDARRCDVPDGEDGQIPVVGSKRPGFLVEETDKLESPGR
jgi:hypothetical protein